MAGAFRGSDPEELETLAVRFGTVADEIDTIVGDLQKLARETPWHGPDAERFRTRLTNELGPKARSSAGLVRDAAHDLKRNAADQRAASEGTGPGVMAAGLGGLLGATLRHTFTDGVTPRTADRFADLPARDPFLAPVRFHPETLRLSPSFRALAASVDHTPLARPSVALGDVMASADLPFPSIDFDAPGLANRWSELLLDIEP